MRRIIIEEYDDENDDYEYGYDYNGGSYSDNRRKYDNGWVGGFDVCKHCPNRPGGPNNKSGFCNCAIPSMYGPFRVTC